MVRCGVCGGVPNGRARRAPLAQNAHARAHRRRGYRLGPWNGAPPRLQERRRDDPTLFGGAPRRPGGLFWRTGKIAPRGGGPGEERGGAPEGGRGAALPGGRRVGRGGGAAWRGGRRHARRAAGHGPSSGRSCPRSRGGGRGG
ncbi:hypothetical protein T484DRAFT_1893755, partial [Baffinella frigidus]